jgi:histidine triad (HIT) family protein
MANHTCVFCQIVDGSIPASVVYKDDVVFAFMSLEQPTPYKVLVATRSHVRDLFDLTDAQATAVFRATTTIARAIKSVSGCEGLNIVQSSGSVGQQDVFHFHLHLITRWPGDSVHLDWPQQPADRALLDSSAAALAHALKS